MKAIFAHRLRFLLTVLALLCMSNARPANESPVFDFNANCRQAYQDIIALRMDAGLSALQKEADNNLLPLLLQNYAEFLRLFVTESDSLYNDFPDRTQQRIKAVRKGPGDDPWNRYMQAECHLHLALIRIRFTDYFQAIWDIRKALKLLERNMELHPGFEPNKKSLGMLYAVLGSVPDKYKIGLSILGMRSDMNTGMQMLNQLVSSSGNAGIFLHETVTVYAFLKFHLENDAQAAWKLLSDHGFPEAGNLMSLYTYSYIGVYGGQAAEVIDLLSAYKPLDGQMAFPQLHYLEGLASIYLQKPAAHIPFERYLRASSSRHHLKSAHQKIAWCALLSGDSLAYFKRLDSIQMNGNATYDADKQALAEAERRDAPQPELLRTRVLTDGGRFEAALQVHAAIDSNSITGLEDLTEYHYRKARALHLSGQTDAAVSAYLLSLAQGEGLSRYFAANAALQLGIIHESQGRPELAREYFKRCLELPDHEYKNGLDQKAKAGLERLQKG